MHLSESISNVEWRVIGVHTKQLHIHTQIALTAARPVAVIIVDFSNSHKSNYSLPAFIPGSIAVSELYECLIINV